jgi:hypothetical protein
MTFRIELTAEAQRDVDAIYEWLVLQYAGETGLSVVSSPGGSHQVSSRFP